MTGPAGEKWEVYTVLADSETFGCSPQTAAPGVPLLRGCPGRFAQLSLVI